MLTSEIRETLNFYFQKPLRAIFSGSSQSGKTYLIGEILKKQKQLFNDTFKTIIYFYPTYLDEPPVDFHSTISDSKGEFQLYSL